MELSRADGRLSTALQQVWNTWRTDGLWSTEPPQLPYNISRNDTIFCYCCIFLFELCIVICIKVNLSLISTKICRIFSHGAFSWINWDLSPRLWVCKIEFPSNWLGKCWTFFSWQCSLSLVCCLLGPISCHWEALPNQSGVLLFTPAFENTLLNFTV